MNKKTELKLSHIYTSVDKENRRIIANLYDQLNKKQGSNPSLGGNIWKRVFNRKRNGATLAKFARRLRLKKNQLEEFICYLNCDIVLEEITEKYKAEMEQYQLGINIDAVISWASEVLEVDNDA